MASGWKKILFSLLSAFYFNSLEDVKLSQSLQFVASKSSNGGIMEAMQLTKENLDLITDYVSTKLQLVQKQEFSQTMLEIKHLRESMKEGFKQMEKRFEQVDKRFEQVDKRFEKMSEDTNRRFAEVDKRFERAYRFMQWQAGIGMAMVAGIYLKLFLG